MDCEHGGLLVLMTGGERICLPVVWKSAGFLLLLYFFVTDLRSCLR